jgi:hypothetical protein
MPILTPSSARNPDAIPKVPKNSKYQNNSGLRKRGIRRLSAPPSGYSGPWHHVQLTSGTLKSKPPPPPHGGRARSARNLGKKQKRGVVFRASWRCGRSCACPGTDERDRPLADHFPRGEEVSNRISNDQAIYNTLHNRRFARARAEDLQEMGHSFCLPPSPKPDKISVIVADARSGERRGSRSIKL